MKKTVRIWFNHWFSTVYHIINLIKQDDSINFYIIGTNESDNSVIKTVCDEWYVEPIFEDDKKYIEYCLDFCRRKSIDVFIPKKNMLLICKYLYLFEKENIRVLLESDYKKLSILNDKEKTYCLFENNNINIVPERYIVNNVKDFCKAYEIITSRHDRACMKFNHDEGALSFRVIDNSVKEYNRLHTYMGSKITYTHAKELLSSQEIFDDIMIMPYLDGIEVSIDCLKTNSGIIIIPRMKMEGRISEIVYRSEFIEICNSFYKKIDLSFPCNIQLKYHNDKLFLLEVNTRMSGGIQYSCLGANINIPNLAVNQLMGIDKYWSINRIPKKISYIETPVLM